MLIAWRLMVRVEPEALARERLQQAETVLRRELRVEKCERYDKIPELWTSNASTPMADAPVADLVTDCLLLADRLARGWHVLGPDLDETGGFVGFEGIFEHRHDHDRYVPDLEWAHFQLLKR